MRINSLFFKITMAGLCLMLFANIGMAQNATVKGMVIDAVNGEAIAATIKISKEDGSVAGGAVADLMTGEYSVSLSPGKYKISITYMSMTPLIQEIELAAGDVKEINAEMKEEVDLMKTVTVTSSKAGTELARNTVSIDVVKPSLVDNTNATKVDDVVDKVPGVQVIDGQANIRGGSGYSFGAGSRVLILVDDLPLMQADAGYASWRDIPVENIDQIEILKGAASALYGSSALNGIINIRTGYAKSKPETKFTLFQTSFMRPRDRVMQMSPYQLAQNGFPFDSIVYKPVTGLAWWADSIRTDIDIVDGDSLITYSDTSLLPKLLSGPIGYRKPIEFGFSFAHRQKFGKFDLTVGGNAFWKDSYLAGEYERKIRGNANMRYRITDSLHVGVNVNLNYGRSASFFLWGNGNSFAIPNYADSLSYMTFPGTITASNILRFNVDPFLTIYDGFGNRHRVQTRIYYVNNQNANNQSNKSTLYYGEYQYQRNFEKLDELKVVAGAVGQYSYAIAQLYGDASYHIANVAGYVQLDKGFIKKDNGIPRLNISLGARYEYNNIISPDTILVSTKLPRIANPEPRSQQARPVFRAGANFEATPVTFIRASWGQGYRYPTIAERYITTFVGDPTSLAALEIRANPSLQSETGWSAEIGVKQGIMITRNWKGFVDLSFFWTEYQNMMEFTFGGGDTSITLTDLFNGNRSIYFQSINIGDTRIRGAEFSVMGMGKIGSVDVNILAGYTYLDPQFKKFFNDSSETRTLQQQLSSNDTTNILKYRNKHTAKFDIEAFFLKKNNLSVGFSVNYTSRMLAVDRVFQDFVLGDNDVPFGPIDAFGIGRYRQHVNSGESVNMSARIGYRHAFMDKEGKNEKMAMKISLVGKNLLNQEYSIRPGLVGAPMNLTVRLDVEF